MNEKNRNVIIIIMLILSILLNLYMFNKTITSEELISTYEEDIDDYEQEIVVLSDKLLTYENNITNILVKLHDLNNTNQMLLDYIYMYEENVGEYEQEIGVMSDKLVTYENNITNILVKLHDLNITNKMLLDYIVKIKNSTNNYTIPYKFRAQEVFQSGDLSIYDSDDLKVIANRYNLIITNYYQKNKEPIELLKENNPSLKVLMYVNIHSIDTSIQSLYDMAQANNWILLDENGNEVYEQNWPFNKCVDVGNSEYRKWLTSLISNRTAEYDFDGILGDNTNPLLETKYGVNSQAINPRTGNTYSSIEYRDDMISLIRSIKDKIGNKIYIGNGVGHLQGDTSLGYWKMKELVVTLIDEEDGVMIEGFLRWNEEAWRSEEAWILNVETLRELSNDNKYTLAWMKVYGTLPEASDWEQVATFGIMSYLMGAEGPNSFFSISGYDFDLFEGSVYTWSNVGFPLEKYHKLDNSGIYTREFTGSIVYVNPTNVRYDLDLKQDMFNIKGNIISNITLQPHEGVLLIRK